MWPPLAASPSTQAAQVGQCPSSARRLGSSSVASLAKLFEGGGNAPATQWKQQCLAPAAPPEQSGSNGSAPAGDELASTPSSASPAQPLLKRQRLGSMDAAEVVPAAGAGAPQVERQLWAQEPPLACQASNGEAGAAREARLEKIRARQAPCSVPLRAGVPPIMQGVAGASRCCSCCSPAPSTQHPTTVANLQVWHQALPARPPDGARGAAAAAGRCQDRPGRRRL